MRATNARIKDARHDRYAIFRQKNTIGAPHFGKSHSRGSTFWQTKNNLHDGACERPRNRPNFIVVNFET